MIYEVREMLDYMTIFEELLDDVINEGDSEFFEEFKKRVIERLNEID